MLSGAQGLTVKLKAVPAEILEPGAGVWLTMVPDGFAEAAGAGGVGNPGPDDPGVGDPGAGAGVTGAGVCTSPIVNPAAVI
jgi:hypothetical protein